MKSKLSDAQVIEMAQRWHARPSLKQFRDEYGVSIQAVRRAINERYRRLVRKGVGK